MKSISRSARGLSSVAIFAFSAGSNAAWGQAEELNPSGGDDTQLLQDALRECANVPSPCNLRLGAGVFQTDVLLVEGFNGSITGHGQGRTILRALPELRSGERPFDDEPTLEAPYPVLLHFYGNSHVSISKLTIEVPEGTTVAPYGHFSFPGAGIENALIAAITVAGHREAKLVLKDVTIAGADVVDAPNFSTLTSAVQFGGEIRNGEGNDRTLKLQRGRFSARNLELQRTGTGIWLQDAEDTHALIVGNELDVRTYGILATDVGSSTVDILLNSIRAGLEGVLLSRDTRPSEAPTDYMVALNRIRVNVDETAPSVGPSYDGVGVFDWSGAPETLNFDADIWANEVILGPNVIAGFGVDSDGPGEIRLVGNRVGGEPPLDSSIRVDLSRGTHIVRNELDQNDPALVDVHLSATTHEARVVEPGDNVLDEGDDNEVQ